MATTYGALFEYQLTAADIQALRYVMIRDDYKPYTSPPTALSRFNKVQKKRFSTNDDLQAIADELISDWEEELQALWDDKKIERMNRGDDEDTAIAKADAAQNFALLRLINSEVKGLMSKDPEFRSSLRVGTSESEAVALLKALDEEAAEEVQWVSSRTGDYASIPLERR